MEGGSVLTVEQALDMARIVDADVISDAEAAKLLQRFTGWSAAEAAEFVSLVRDREEDER